MLPHPPPLRPPFRHGKRRADGLGARSDRAACENFYLHACNGWLKANPIPPDQAAGAWTPC
ncbi:MAG: hypothetical protein WDN69_11365 [Aliidongia sp.]